MRARADPFVVKAPEMWAEHHCDAPLEQWSIGNETYFTALDDPAEALGRGYGVPTPTAIDLEWYAVEPPIDVGRHGFVQDGVVHGVDRGGGRAAIDARRGAGAAVAPVEPRARRSTPSSSPTVVAHTGLRAPFAFPDGTVADWVVSPSGWARRRAR